MSKRPRKVKVIQVQKPQKDTTRQNAVLYMLVKALFEKVQVLEQKMGIEPEQVKDVDQGAESGN